jgi:hypothetical protein
MFRKVLPICLLLVVLTSLAAAQASRHFTFHYAFAVNDIPSGEKVRIWIPAAHSDSFQEVKVVSASGDLKLKKTHESKYGNEMYYAEISHSNRPVLHFDLTYDVVRHERIVLGIATPHLEALKLNEKERKQDLSPDKLVPISGEPAQLASSATQGKTADIDKARAIYDYVFRNMTYDKSGTGWGRGDVLYACSAKKGNCTDFHSLFIAMARAQGIPARFEIGFSLPPGTHSSDIAGYHCWSDFFDPDHGWVPVDISEAWKNPVKQNYFFGAHDENRMQFTMGRDLELSPKQDGEPLNYFVYPYVEVAGQPYAAVANAFSFADEGGAGPSIGK